MPGTRTALLYPYANGVRLIESQNIARVKDGLCLHIANFFAVQLHAALLDQASDFAPGLR